MITLTPSHKQPAFTIVELLIVIVVIGILAAIGIVSYIGITQNAADADVKSNLASIAKLEELYKVKNGQYASDSYTISILNNGNVFPAARSAYMQSATVTYNLGFCTDTASPIGEYYAVFAMSSSGSMFYISNLTGSVQSYSTGSWALGTMCPSVGFANTGIWAYSSGSWQSWIGGQ